MTHVIDLMKEKMRRWLNHQEMKLRILIEVFMHVKLNRFFYFMLAIIDFSANFFLSLVPSRIKENNAIIDCLVRLLDSLKRLNKFALVCINGKSFFVIDYEALNIVLPSFERAVAKYMDYVAKKYRQGVFVDIGAHVGKYSIRMAKYGWNVLALEPHPLNFIFLVLNAKINGCDIKALRVAAYSSKKTLKFFLSDYSGRHSIIRRSNKYIFVRAEPLDHIVDSFKYSTNSINLIKIDVEGVAVEVLKGMLNLLKRIRPHIIIEVTPEEKVALDILRSLNYLIVPIIDEKIGHYYYYYAFPGDRGQSYGENH